MSSRLQTLNLSGTTAHLYQGSDCDARSPLIVTFLTAGEAEDLAKLLPEHIRVAAIDEADWERVFTPWPAPRLFKQSADFGGGADAYLSELTDTVLPELEQQQAIVPEWRGLAGFSLAGLFAVCAAYQCAVFQRIASVSGSLWYDDWLDFMRGRRLLSLPERAYFSVGDREKNSNNPRLAVVEQATRDTAAVWQQQGVDTCFELNRGGHVADVAERMAKALLWLSF